MNQPWIYMCSPSRSPLPPPSPPHPFGYSQCISPEHLSHASNLGWWSVSPLIVYLFQCCSLWISHPCLLPQSLKVFPCVSKADNCPHRRGTTTLEYPVILLFYSVKFFDKHILIATIYSKSPTYERALFREYIGKVLFVYKSNKGSLGTQLTQLITLYRTIIGL